MLDGGSTSATLMTVQALKIDSLQNFHLLFLAIQSHMKYHLTMTITIDQAGRVVVPKSLRERFGLHDGTELEVEATADGIHLRPHHSGPSFVEKEGILVHHGRETAAGIDVATFINRQRETRALENCSPNP